MFTDRFIRLPIHTFSQAKDDLGLDDIDETNVTIRLDPSEIESYSNEWKDEAEVVSIRTKSGEAFCVYLTMRDFEKRLNEMDRGAEQREFVNVETHEHSKLNMP